MRTTPQGRQDWRDNSVHRDRVMRAYRDVPFGRSERSFPPVVGYGLLAGVLLALVVL